MICITELASWRCKLYAIDAMSSSARPGLSPFPVFLRCGTLSSRSFPLRLIHLITAWPAILSLSYHKKSNSARSAFSPSSILGRSTNSRWTMRSATAFPSECQSLDTLVPFLSLNPEVIRNENTTPFGTPLMSACGSIGVAFDWARCIGFCPIHAVSPGPPQNNRPQDGQAQHPEHQTTLTKRNLIPLEPLRISHLRCIRRREHLIVPYAIMGDPQSARRELVVLSETSREEEFDNCRSGI